MQVNLSTALGNYSKHNIVDIETDEIIIQQNQLINLKELEKAVNLGIQYIEIIDNKNIKYTSDIELYTGYKTRFCVIK